jgi:hypothetical protein
MFAQILLAGALALGGWGADGCGPVGSPAPAAGYEWRQFPGDPGHSYLYLRGALTGAYDHDADVYFAWADRGGWGAPQTPPWAPAAERRPAAAVKNFGVDTDKLSGHRAESYRINGRSASRAQVQQALADNRVPDDAGRLRLTAIGEPALTARVAADVAGAPALAEWKDRLVVHGYPPDHWAVARAGYVAAGRPTIYLQAPAGKVLHRQDDYADGPAGLARALRRADPNYDAKKDPDLRPSPARPRLDLSAVPAPVWLLAAGAAYLWFRRSSRPSWRSVS